MILHAVDEGPVDGPALVLLCSLGTTLEMWAPQRRVLSARFRVVSLDTRGHGDSPVPPGPYAVGDLAGDVLETLDGLGIGRTALAGVSLGGAVAQSIALSAPQRVSALALLCTSARFSEPGRYRERAATVRAEGTDAVAEAVVARWFTERYTAEEPGVVARMRAMIAATPAEGYAGCCEAIAGWDVRARLGGIGAPTLVVAGAEDPATPPEHARQIAGAVPGARLEILDDAAHLASFQRPQIVTPLLEAHLDAAR